MNEEKRLKLGIDIGELSSQLVQLNSYIEQNYQKAVQGQSEYNRILEQSLTLLNKQVELTSQLGISNQIPASNNGPIQSQPIGGGEDDASSKLNDSIQDIVAGISSLEDLVANIGINSPIKVEVVNGPSQDDHAGQNSNGANQSSGQNNNGTNQNSNDRNGSSYAAGAVNVVAGGASDPNYILAGVAGMIPVVGAGIASIISKTIGEAEQREDAWSSYRAATGGNFKFRGLTGLGYTTAEAYQKYSQYYPANIGLSVKDLQFEKGYGIGGGTMSALLKSMREEISSEFSSSELGVSFLTALSKRGGIESKAVRGYSEEYLKILVDLNQKQLETTGETNSLINSEVVTGIAKTSEKFGDPTVLSRVVQGIQGGLINAPSAQAEALQYWAMSEANPNADIWEMQLMREDPFGEKSRGYFSNYLGALMQTGNAKDVRFNVMNAFGLSAHQTEEFLSGIEKAKAKQGASFNLQNYLEGYDFDTLKKSGELEDAGKKIAKEGWATVTKNQVLLAKTADKLADVGEEVLNLTNIAVDKISDGMDMFQKFLKGELGLGDIIYEAVKKALGEPKAKEVKKYAEETNKRQTVPNSARAFVPPGAAINLATPNSLR